MQKILDRLTERAGGAHRRTEWALHGLSQGIQELALASYRLGERRSYRANRIHIESSLGSILPLLEAGRRGQRKPQQERSNLAQREVLSNVALGVEYVDRQKFAPDQQTVVIVRGAGKMQLSLRPALRARQTARAGAAPWSWSVSNALTQCSWMS